LAAADLLPAPAVESGFIAINSRHIFSPELERLT